VIDETEEINRLAKGGLVGMWASDSLRQHIITDFCLLF
jgi:hypothetical protein